MLSSKRVVEQIVKLSEEKTFGKIHFEQSPLGRENNGNTKSVKMSNYFNSSNNKDNDNKNDNSSNNNNRCFFLKLVSAFLLH